MLNFIRYCTTHRTARVRNHFSTQLLFCSLFFCFNLTLSLAQSSNTQQLLRKVLEKQKSINDFQVNARVHVDIDFIKLSDRTVTIFFKQPAKLKYQAEGFFIMPKNYSANLLSIIKPEELATIYLRSEMLNGERLEVIKAMSLNDTSEILLATLWIDEKKLNIRKIEANTRSTGKLDIQLDYTEKSSPLPSKVTIDFEMENMALPVIFTGEFDKVETRKSGKKKFKGQVIITYSGYKINQGLSDTIFTSD
jgi:hypothetical protein